MNKAIDSDGDITVATPSTTGSLPRQVTFSNHVGIHTVPRQSSKLWYSSRDLRKIHRRDNMLLKLIRHKLFIESDQETVRGLTEGLFCESLLSPSQLLVLDHCQRVEPQKLAQWSYVTTKESREQARQRAMCDREWVIGKPVVAAS